MSGFELEELLEEVLQEDARVEPPPGMERRIVALAMREGRRPYRLGWAVAAFALAAFVLVWHPPRPGETSPTAISYSVGAGAEVLTREEAPSLPRLAVRSRAAKLKSKRMAVLQLEEAVTIMPIAIAPLAVEPLEVASLSMNESQRER